ncbi:MAG: molybdopterin oxidoreductase, partial [Tepidisphaeraceae bacterium]
MSKDRRHVSLPVVSRTPRCDEPAEPHPDEFRPGASVWDSRFSRRSFLQTMTASLALAGLYGCSDRPSEAIVPYVDPPEQVVPGEPLFFASTLTRGGYGRGVLVTSHEGRPTKIEGNPDHPASLGAADVGMQADVLSLYDPKRSQTVTHAGQASTWGKLIETLNQHLARTGDGLCVLTGACTSPTLIDQLDQLRRKDPSAAFFSSEPIDRSNTRRGAQLAFGQLAEPIYHLDRCDVIVALDSDFLWDEPGSLPYARQFADRRRTHANGLSMSRLYAAEGNFSVTGSKADHRLPATPAQVAHLAQALLNALQNDALQNGQALADLPPAHARWLAAAVADLQAARGRSLIVVGDSQPPEIHALAAAINQQLGNIGTTVEWIPPVVDPRGGNLRDLVHAIHRGEVRTLLMLCENPVRHSPNDIPLAEALQQLSTALAPDGSYQNFVLHHGLYANETAYVSQWHVPAHHALESWSDARAFDSTASIVQPLIAPLYASRSAGDVISLLLDEPHRSPYECVRRYWQSQTGIHQPDAFETWWNRVLQRGVIDGTRAQPIPVSQAAAPALGASTAASSTGLVLLLRPDYSVWDGSAFHNPWLQELPRPLSKIVWGNAALLGPATAAKYGVVEQDVIRLSAGGSSVEVPAVL